MTDIEYWDGELSKKLDELDEAIKGLKGASGSGKEEVSQSAARVMLLNV